MDDVKGLRYLEDVVTLELDVAKCTGCRMCTLVCPHAVFEMRDKRAFVRDRGACMECGACALNCAAGAITVTPGVGCAQAIIRSWILGGDPSCDCGGGLVRPAGASSAKGASSCATPAQPSATCGGEAENGAPAAPC